MHIISEWLWNIYAERKLIIRINFFLCVCSNRWRRAIHMEMTTRIIGNKNIGFFHILVSIRFRHYLQPDFGNGNAFNLNNWPIPNDANWTLSQIFLPFDMTFAEFHSWQKKSENSLINCHFVQEERSKKSQSTRRKRMKREKTGIQFSSVARRSIPFY